jgi:hypothetical protein
MVFAIRLAVQIIVKYALLVLSASLVSKSTISILTSNAPLAN